MTTKKNTLETLHEAIGAQLLHKIQEGEATAADLNVARQFLKDNGIDAVGERDDDPLNKIAASLPYQTDSEQIDPLNHH